MTKQTTSKWKKHLYLLFIKNLTLEISAVLRQDCVDVFLEDLIDSEQTTHQLSTDSDSNVTKTVLLKL